MVNTVRIRIGEIASAVVICLLAFALRVGALGGANLGFDGGLTVALARMPLIDLLDFSTRDVHPPLFALILKLWLRLAGPSLATAMWPSLASGVIAVAAAWWIGRSLVGWRAGAVMALLLALNPLAVHDGMAVRDFVVVVPMVLLSTGLIASDVAGSSPLFGRRSVLFALLYVIIALSSVYFVAIAFTHVGAIVLMRRSPRRWLALAAPGLIAFSVWSAILLIRIGPILAAGSRPTDGTAPDPITLVRAIFLAVVGGPNTGSLVNGALGWALIVICGGLVALVPNLRDRLHRDAPRSQSETSRVLWCLSSFGFVCVFLSIFAAVLLWLNEPVPGRYALILLPYAIVLVGLGLESLSHLNRNITPAIVLFAVAPLLIGLLPANQAGPLPGNFWDPIAMVNRLDSDTFVDDRIIFISLEQAGYYAAMTRQPRPWVVVPVGPRYLEGDLVANASARAEQLTENPGRVWLVLYQGGIAPRHRLVRDALYARAFPSGEINLPDSRVLIYAVPGGPEAKLSTVPIAEYQAAQLVSVQRSGAISSGRTIGVTLNWVAKEPLDQSYRAFVHLLNERGDKVGQWDTVPADETRPTNHWMPGETIVDRHGLFIPWDTTGNLSIAVGLYADNGRLQRVNGGDTTIVRLAE